MSTDPGRPADPTASAATPRDSARSRGRRSHGRVRAWSARNLRVAAWLTGLGGAVAALARIPGAVPLLVASLALAVAASLLLHPGRGDRALAAFIAVLLLPALLVIGLVVKLTSRGPALVRPPRAGADGPPPPLRFRTSDAAGPAAATPSPVTPVGQLLRRLCLDELPRLLDAVMGRAPFLRISRR